ncbi:MAG: hypothetical protein H0U67_03980 [Gemmatimonadetes bacterium]|nr:hypothetical protein [Gemmatimonadota bacterium]
MRKMTLWAAVAAFALLGSAGNLSAQTRPFTIGISGGPSFPSGAEFSNEANTGYHVQGSLGFAPAMLPVGVRADLLWQEFPDEHGGNFREIGGLANAILALPLAIARPYLLGGIGAINHNPPDEEHGDHAHAEEGRTTSAFAVGGGIEFPFLGLSGVLEARYLVAGEHRAVPISVGIRF